MHTSSKNSLADQCGFTLLEMMIATAIMLLGFVGVAQLVPVAMNSNWLNRDDSTKLVLAQRELNEMIDQLNQSMAAASFTDDQNNQGSLANGGNPTITINNRPVIDFNAAPVANYSFNYTDVSGAAGLCARCASARQAAGPDLSKVDLGKFGGSTGAPKDDRLRADLRGVQEKSTEPRGEP